MWSDFVYIYSINLLKIRAHDLMSQDVPGEVVVELLSSIDQFFLQIAKFPVDIVINIGGLW